MAKNIKISSSINIREIFQNQYDSKINSQDFEVLMSHFGLFPQNLISKISLTAEQLLIDRSDEKKSLFYLEHFVIKVGFIRPIFEWMCSRRPHVRGKG